MVGAIPNTGMVGVYRIEPKDSEGESRFKLVGMADDPATGMLATLN